MTQLVLPLPSQPALGRADFLVAPGNAQAVAFLDSWPRWSAPAALLHGPAASGKTHLAGVWAKAANAALFAAAMLATEHAAIADALAAFRVRQTDDVASNDDPRK